jgi:MYXO-CTERM domain-containing protein
VGTPIAWRNPCVEMNISLAETQLFLTADDLLRATTQALEAWSYPQVACTDVRLSLEVRAEELLGAANDRDNIIAFRRDSWCRTPTPINDAGVPEPDCYPSSALAVTSIFKKVKSGEILDADVEFNAVNYAWGDLALHPELATGSTADFQNALTHEIGHVLGLDHNCYTVNDGPTRLTDNTGMPTVDCYSNPDLPLTVAEATMYPSVALDDTARRVLTPDDELGVCEIYPHVHDTCPAPPSEGGCSVASTATPRRGWPVFFLAGLALLLIGVALRRVHGRI